MIESTAPYQAAVTGKARRVYIRAEVDISDPDISITGVSSSALAPWSKAAELYDKNIDPPVRYATLERNRWLLDGSFNLFPDGYQVPENMGAATAAICDEDHPQSFELRFSGVSILQGFSVFFSSDAADGVPSDFTVEVFYNQTAYFTKTVTDNTANRVVFDGFTVYDPTSIKITVTKMSVPGRRVRVMEIVAGVYEVWTEKMFASFTVSHQGNFSCITLPYGTANFSFDNHTRRFEPRRKDGLFQSIEERQGVKLSIGVMLPDKSVEFKPVGMFYQTGDGWKTSNNSLAMSWSLVDIIGLVSDRTFLPPTTLPKTLSGWIAAVVAQLGKNFAKRYHVDPAYASTAITANSADDVTGKKCGDIIRWACMAAGVWPRADAETGDLTAEPLWSQGNKVQLRNLVDYPAMKANESIAALIFQLADANKTELVISGNQTSSEKTITIQNPFIHTSDQALKAARLILSCYGGNVYETTGRGDPASEIGDVDTLWLDKSNAAAARRMSQTFNFQDGVMQSCTSKLLQPDGSYLYEGFAIIRESCTWKAPAGVTQLRVVIGAGGQGGGVGQDGQWLPAGSSYISFSGYKPARGEKGVDGIGGKIWYGVISINPEQEFVVRLGAGGAAGTVYGQPGSYGGETSFGVYTSAEGRLYENGYTDIANGQVFARTGVPVPLSGSGDGGVGGAGGDPGEGYLDSYNYTPVGAASSVVNTRYEWVTTKEPGPGYPGAAGATGFVMVTWDKEEET